jgi:phospholipid/cholesterol/gamma-HCH transport system permease protein
LSHPALSELLLPARWGLALLGWLRGWWRALVFAAEMLVLALSPSSYRAAQRPALAREMHDASLPLLPAFLSISAVVCLVIIQIVMATAASYGLSRFALDLLVRTLVLELMPLLVALYVAVRYTMPGGEEIAEQRERGVLKKIWRGGGDPARDLLLPRVLAGVFSVALLAASSCVLALILTYLSVYGFTTWAFAAYTRSVGQVFNPAVSLIFALKAFFFSLAVSILPLAGARDGGVGRVQDHIGLLGRVFAVILLVKVLSLVGNYY